MGRSSGERNGASPNRRRVKRTSVASAGLYGCMRERGVVHTQSKTTCLAEGFWNRPPERVRAP